MPSWHQIPFATHSWNLDEIGKDTSHMPPRSSASLSSSLRWGGISVTWSFQLRVAQFSWDHESVTQLTLTLSSALHWTPPFPWTKWVSDICWIFVTMQSIFETQFSQNPALKHLVVWKHHHSLLTSQRHFSLSPSHPLFVFLCLCIPLTLCLSSSVHWLTEMLHPGWSSQVTTWLFCWPIFFITHSLVVPCPLSSLQTQEIHLSCWATWSFFSSKTLCSQI